MNVPGIKLNGNIIYFKIPSVKRFLKDGNISFNTGPTIYPRAKDIHIQIYFGSTIIINRRLQIHMFTGAANHIIIPLYMQKNLHEIPMGMKKHPVSVIMTITEYNNMNNIFLTITDLI